MHVLIVLLKVLGYIVLFSLAVTLIVVSVGFVIEKTLKLTGYRGDAKDKAASILGALPVTGFFLLCGLSLCAAYYEHPVVTSALTAFGAGYFGGFIHGKKDAYASIERRNDKDVKGKATGPSAHSDCPPNAQA
jgi:hypothetical protein